MKLNLAKGIAVALALSASVSAHAITSGAGGANGELFFTIWDPTAGQEASYTVGLNLFVGTAANPNNFDGNGSYTFASIFSDPQFLAVFGDLTGQSAWQWNIAGSKNLSESSVLLYTAAAASSVINNNATDTGAVKASDFIPLLTPLAGGTDEFGTNLPASGGFGGNANTWNNNFAGAVPVDNTAGVGQAMNFYQAANSFLTTEEGLADATMTQYAYTWALDTAGNLTYNAVTAPVPIPAAVWLLASGLVGLVGVGRRRAARS